MNDGYKIGQILRSLRQLKHLSKAKVATDTGLTQQHISGIESGKFGVPMIDTLVTLAEYYNCSLFYIIGIVPKYIAQIENRQIKDIVNALIRDRLLFDAVNALVKVFQERDHGK
jgi:transcriptional regulator with XRE-family HTH domain